MPKYIIIIGTITDFLHTAGWTGWQGEMEDGWSWNW